MSIPTWIKDIEAFGSVISALATISVGIAAGRIAYTQTRTARQKLRLDLFEIRFAVYDSTLSAIRLALNRGAESIFHPTIEDFNQQLRRARFLFDKECFNYLDTIHTKVMGYVVMAKTIDADQYRYDPNYAKILEEHHAEAKWLLQSMRDLNTMLGPQIKVDETIDIELLRSTD